MFNERKVLSCIDNGTKLSGDLSDYLCNNLFDLVNYVKFKSSNDYERLYNTLSDVVKLLIDDGNLVESVSKPFRSNKHYLMAGFPSLIGLTPLLDFGLGASFALMGVPFNQCLNVGKFIVSMMPSLFLLVRGVINIEGPSNKARLVEACLEHYASGSVMARDALIKLTGVSLSDNLEFDQLMDLVDCTRGFAKFFSKDAEESFYLSRVNRAFSYLKTNPVRLELQKEINNYSRGEVSAVSNVIGLVRAGLVTPEIIASLYTEQSGSGKSALIDLYNSVITGLSLKTNDNLTNII